MIDERFGQDTGNQQWRTVRVLGLVYIFKILCLICRIMIYRLPVMDSIDRDNVDDFKKELKALEKGDVE